VAEAATFEGTEPNTGAFARTLERHAVCDHRPGMREVDAVAGKVIGAAIRVHRKFGPGLFESVYTPCLAHELLAQGLHVEVQKPLSIQHEGMTIHRAYVIDIIVEGLVIVEIKSISQLAPIHTAQILTYLRLTGLEVGLIINFNVPRLVDGVKRVVNNYREAKRDTPSDVPSGVDGSRGDSSL
jgi:GxxExxY protein